MDLGGGSRVHAGYDDTTTARGADRGCPNRGGDHGRVLYRVGHPFSEWVGEATLVRDASGSWDVARFEEYPPLGG
jgi:hypothetical protein